MKFDIANKEDGLPFLMIQVENLIDQALSRSDSACDPSDTSGERCRKNHTRLTLLVVGRHRRAYLESRPYVGALDELAQP
jgi:hypothetical protein